MSKRTREEKNAKSQQLAKPDGISTGRKFAQSYCKVRLLIDHPHSYREWNIVGRCDVPGRAPKSRGLSRVAVWLLRLWLRPESRIPTAE